MKTSILMCLLFLTWHVKSQTITDINVRYLSELNGKEIEAVSHSGNLLLNMNTGQFTFKDVLGSIQADSLAIDTLLDHFQNSKVIYEGNIQENINDFMLGDIKANQLHIVGNLTINGVTKSIEATCVPLRYNRSSSDLYMDFNLLFNPSDFKLMFPDFPFKDELEISVKNGFVSKIE